MKRITICLDKQTEKIWRDINKVRGYGWVSKEFREMLLKNYGTTNRMLRELIAENNKKREELRDENKEYAKKINNLK